MVRKLALAVSLALANLSVPAHALGLGELSSNSALNQNFRGEINLLSVPPDEIASVRVSLADQEAFSRAGVERPFYLSLLRFEPTLSAAGKPVIQVSSEFPIREPFLNFLVEVNWPNGRLLREYTVLLDPPTTTNRRAPVVQAPTRTSPSRPRPAVSTPPPRPAPVPAVAAPTVSAPAPAQDVYGPVKANDTAWSIARDMRPAGVTMEQMMMALLEANPAAFVDNDINRLRRGKILRVPTIDEIQRLSRAQARTAYRQQQDDWLARRDAKLQAAQEATAEPAPTDAADGDASEAPDRLRIATARPEGEGEAGAGDDDAATPVASDLSERLIAARENAETSRQEAETLRSRVDDLQARLEKMQRLLSLKDEQLARLQDSVATAETETAPETEAAPEIEEAVVEADVPGDDVELANQIEAAAEAEVPPLDEADPGTDIVIGSDDVPADVGQVIDDVVAELTAPADEPVAPAVDPAAEGYRIESIAPQVDPDKLVLSYGSPAADEVVVETDEAVVTTPPEEEVVIGGLADAAPATTESPAPEEAADAEQAPVQPVVAKPASAKGSDVLPPGLAALVEKNIVPIAAGGIALLGLLGWLFTRGRRRPEEEAVVAAEPEAAEVAESAAEAAVDEPILNADAMDDLPDSAFLDDFSPRDVNALQDETGEVDPVSEADVYIAYGRYQQADELLRQALDRDPGRLALKHKLLEVHYATRDSDAFAALAQDMVDAGQDAADPMAWARATDMGREIAPGNPLFARRDGDDDVALGRVAAAAAAGGAAGTVDRDTLSLEDVEISELTAAYEEEASNLNDLEAPSEVTITLDLEDDSNLAASPMASEAPESISLDGLESLDFELPAADTESASAGDSSGDDMPDTFDLDSMMKQAEEAADLDGRGENADSEFSAAELQAQLDELSDLSLLDTSLQASSSPVDTEQPGLGLVAEDAGTPEQGLDQPISLDDAFDAAQEEGSDDVIDLDLEESPAASEDEVATKLDLARAYLEMGDQDGARGILDEVVAEGSAEQRGEAEKLLADLA